MTQLRPYQTSINTQVGALLARKCHAVLVRLATGGGKSFTMSTLAAGLQRERGIVQAHRAELVGQLSIALGTIGVRHALTVSTSTRRLIVEQHFEKFGRSMYDPGAAWSVESVDTAIRRSPRYDVKYVMPDECHHVLPHNKWGKACAMYPDAQIIGWTATPCRTDGQGLGVEAGGLFAAMVEGPGAAELMADGYLCEYDVKVAIPSDLNLSSVEVTASGELNMRQASEAVHASGRIVGDAVGIYQQHAPGKLMICFAVDIAGAQDLHARFVAAGISAAVVTGEDLDADRAHVIRQFMLRQITVLINVDLFGEGFDVPGVEVVMMCRPTASFQWFSQAVGRGLRPDVDWSVYGAMWDTLGAAGRRLAIAGSRKPRALVIDLVGNFLRTYRIGDAEHVGPPELFTGWSLDGRTRKRQVGDAIPQRICLGCTQPYERFYDACPHCGTAPPAPEPGTAPSHVDGNLYSYDAALLAQLRAEVARIDGPAQVAPGLSGPAMLATRGNWNERQQAQRALREAIALWAGHRPGRSEAELHREFYLTFNVDVLGAAALSAKPAAILLGQIMERCAL